MEEVMFSVIIPVYNKANYIKRAVRSVQSQRPHVGEIIVVDDGSTDGGGVIAKAIAENDVRIRVVTQMNSGVSSARNRGARESGQPYLCFLDADDELCPGFMTVIQSLVDNFQDCDVFATGYCIQYGNSELHRPAFKDVPQNESGGRLHRFFRSTAKGASPLCASAICIDRVAFFQIGGFPEGITHAEDRITWARLALNYNIAWSPFIGAVYHKEAENRSSKTWRPEKGTAYLEFLEKEALTQASSKQSTDVEYADDIQLSVLSQHRIIFNNSIEHRCWRSIWRELAWLMRNDKLVRLPVHCGRIVTPRFVRQLARKLLNNVR